ncbi:hypothetical protein FGO68_gene9381 [Halteria grandinella]|uniref:Uncharacterized protein n=1 Tax=Halteria grandinella TaxID=5974 RepID=A0A8J8NPY1_HALGN|nr:hypothetical protein FGO68_gene9381 [Halteria grandinella]
MRTKSIGCFLNNDFWKLTQTLTTVWINWPYRPQRQNGGNQMGHVKLDKVLSSLESRLDLMGFYRHCIIKFADCITPLFAHNYSTAHEISLINTSRKSCFLHIPPFKLRTLPFTNGALSVLLN